jgi:hypothetical protein
MTEAEFKEIYDRLLVLTKSGAIQWKKTGDTEFTTSFVRSSVTIQNDYNYHFDELDRPPKVLRIYNDDGLLIAYGAPDELSDEGYAAQAFILDPSELFNLVKERVYKFSETTENILEELRKLKAS